MDRTWRRLTPRRPEMRRAAAAPTISPIIRRTRRRNLGHRPGARRWCRCRHPSRGDEKRPGRCERRAPTASGMNATLARPGSRARGGPGVAGSRLAGLRPGSATVGGDHPDARRDMRPHRRPPAGRGGRARQLARRTRATRQCRVKTLPIPTAVRQSVPGPARSRRGSEVASASGQVRCPECREQRAPAVHGAGLVDAPGRDRGPGGTPDAGAAWTSAISWP
jgi:hypothetical protein